jgi:hypothetical protein
MKSISGILKGGGARGQLWRRAWFASGLIALVAVIVHTQSNQSLPHSTDDVLAEAFEQRVMMQRVVKTALQLDDAVSEDDYDSIEPVMGTLVHNSKAFEQVHTLLASQGGAGIDEPIARLANPYIQISRGLDELILVGKSAERRAPYIDSETRDRISRAAKGLILYEQQYEEGLSQITALRQKIVNNQRADFRSSSLTGLFVLIGLVMCTTPIVVFPALSAIGASGSGKGDDENQPGEQGGATAEGLKIQPQPDTSRRAA